MKSPFLDLVIMKHLAFFSILLCSVNLFSQQEDHKWIFNFWSGDSCTLNSIFPDICGASILDFNTLPPSVYRKPELTLDFGESQAIICDKNGELMLYSNGQSIHESRNRAIDNGDTINYGITWRNLTWWNEAGVEKPNGFRIAQGVGFIPQPESDTILALYQNHEKHYQAEEDIGFIELWSAKIVPLNNGGYTLVEKDSVINDRIYKDGAITACRHGNGRDWWMLQFNRDTVYHYLVDPTGIGLSHISTLPFILRGTLGQSKFSPQGEKFAMHGSFDLGFSGEESRTDVMIADFDRCSGNLMNPIISLQPGKDVFLDAGLEFSPNGQLLYISTLLDVFQFDLTVADIFGSKLRVGTYNGGTCGEFISPINFGQMQLAPDNKIYVSRSFQCYNISVVDFPNVRGLECSFRQNVIELPTYTEGTVPNFNTYRLGPLDGSSCDTLGIGNNPVSRFWYEQDTLDYLTVQFWDVSYFRPESWEWDFGDGVTSMHRMPEHTFSENGEYEVCLTVSNENSSHTSCQTLNIGTTSSSTISSNIDISVFPNPVVDNLRVQLGNYLPQRGVILIYDLSGKLVLTHRVTGGTTTVSVSALDSGTYLYEIRDGAIVMGSGTVVSI